MTRNVKTDILRMPIEIDIDMASSDWENVTFDIESCVHNAVESALSEENILSGQNVEVSIVLTDDAAIKELNKSYRDKDKPTNVLSFPQVDVNEISVMPGGIMLGDVILAYETIAREAEEQNKSFKSHLTHMLVHGSLHLLGHDHIENDEAEIMESLEIKILSDLGIKNPYSDENFVA